MKSKLRSKSWKIVGAFVVVVSLVLTIATGAFATGGPHDGTFTSTTDSCASCHRAHTGTAAKILGASSQYALCTTCHGGGSGADTDVTTGIYLSSANGTLNAGLRGGGFESAKMDTGLTSSPTSANITSKHTIGATSAIAWGSGTSSNGENVALECGNCHNPHGNSNYRILRPKPTSLSGSANLTSANVTGSNTYTITYDGSYYRDMTGYDSNVLSQMADWCGQCHTRYKAGAGSESSTASGADWPTGTAPFEYRHRTQGVTGECLRCHVAHGTSASMTGNAASSTYVTWPSGNATASWQDTDEGEYSRLLHIDNRGVCMQCHTSSDLNGN